MLEIRHLKTLHALRETDSLVEAAERVVPRRAVDPRLAGRPQLQRQIDGVEVAGATLTQTTEQAPDSPFHGLPTRSVIHYNGFAATTRTGVRMLSVPPTRVNCCSVSTRRILLWVPSGISATSSK
mgnify:CR=1 FL=1